MEESGLVRLVRRTSEINIGEEKIKVKPSPRDAEVVLAYTGAGASDEKIVNKMTTVMKDIIKRANPEITEEDLDFLVATNYGTILAELLVLYGFVSRDKMEAIRKKAEDSIKTTQ
jgi:hypothetical protein